jgi:signal transduction histidine kinase
MEIVATITLGLAAFALGAAILNAWIFWMRPREPAHLWLGVACIGVTWLAAGLAATYGARTLDAAQEAMLLALVGALPLVAGFIRFSELYAGIRHPFLGAGIAATGAFTVLIAAQPSLFFDGTVREVAMPFGAPLLQAGVSPLAHLAYALFAAMVVMLVVAYARRARSLDGGRSIAAAIALWGACMLNDMGVGLGVYTAPWLLPLGFVGFAGVLGSLLLRRLVLSKRQVESSADELRALVDARTEELRRKDLELAHGARLATLGALAGGIAHGIERPLAAIDAHVKELRSAWRESAQPGAFAELLASAQRNVEHVSGVVAELLQLARREEGRRGLHELATVVAGVLPIAGYELRRRARLETNLTSTPPIHGDGAMLSQIALNLIVGAIQAFPESPPQPNALISLTTEARDGRAWLVVHDNVPAPPSGSAIDLFELSGIAEGERERERRLQLAVTKQLVERHRGTLEIESGLAGTRVLASFPAADAQEPAA